MATSLGGGIGNIVSFKSAGDLSSCQYYPVKLTAANKVGTCSATTDEQIGILQNKPEAENSPADVLLLAGCISKVVTGGTCAAATRVTQGTDGRVVSALTADAVNSRYNLITLEASTAVPSRTGPNFFMFLYVVFLKKNTHI